MPSSEPRRSSERIEADSDAKRNKFGVEGGLKDIPGVTTQMLVAFGEHGRAKADIALIDPRQCVDLDQPKLFIAVEFWRHNNLWRMIFFPILYILVLMFWRNLFWKSAEISRKLGGGQCLLISDFPNRAGIQIYFATMFIITIIEITTPSLIHNVKPKYSERQRIGYAVLHSFAWTSFSLGISQLFRMVVCGTG